MANISSEVLKRFCEPEWVSRAYGEYLLDCSEQSAKLLGEVTDAVGDDSLEELIDEKSTSYGNVRNTISDLVRKDIELSGDFTKLEDLQPGSSKFVHTFLRLERDSSSSIAPYLNQLQLEFGNIDVHDYDVLYGTSPDEAALTVSTVLDRVTTLVNSICTAHKMPSGAAFCLNEGFVDFRTLLAEVIKRGAIGEQTTDFTMTATNGKDVVITAITTNFATVIEQIKTSFASAVAWGEGFLTVGKGAVADAIASFESQVGNVIKDFSANFSSAVNNVRSTIAACGNNVINFVSNAYEQLGWKQVVDDVFNVVNDTDVAEYTGASPFSSICLKTAGDALVATGKTILAVGCGIFNGVFNILKKLWNKARPFVSFLTANPTDIQVSNSDDQSYTLSGMQFKTISPDYSHKQITFILSTTGPDDEYSDEMEATIRNLFNKWYAIDTFFGQLCFQFKNVSNNGYISACMDIIYKPKCLNFNDLNESGLFPIIDLGPDATYNVWGNPDASGRLNFDAWLLRNHYYFDDQSLLGTPAGEALAWMGFGASMLLMQYLSHEVMLEMGTSMEYEYGFKISGFTDNIANRTTIYRADNYPLCQMSWDRVSGIRDPKAPPMNLNNKDFLVQGSGYIDSPSVSQDYDGFYYYNPDAKNSSMSGQNTKTLLDIVGGLICAFVIQQYDKQHSPDDYCFLPYCKDTEGFTAGRYSIVTDKQYKDIMTLIANAVVFIAVVALVVVLGASIIKMFKINKQIKWASKQGKLDNKMWNGGELTFAEKLRYHRATKKNSAINDVISGMAGSTPITQRVNDTVGVLRDLQIVPDKANAESTSTNVVYDEVKYVVKLIKG